MNDIFDRSGGVAIAIRRISQAPTDVDYYFAACKSGRWVEDISWIPNGRFERFDLKTANPIRVVKELYRFRRWFKVQRCDLVHCHHRRLAVLLQLVRIPVLYTGHLAFPQAAWFRWLHPRRMTAVSRSVATNIRETTGHDVLVSINPPVQFPQILPLVDISKVQRRAVCVARLEPVKGHTHLLAAWKLLRDRGFKCELDLVGEGSLRPILEAQIQRDDLEQLIRFRGFTTDVSRSINNALFAILVSEVEGQPAVVLEAASMGRASLLSAIPASIDLLPPGRTLRNGIAFGDVAALADALEEWFAHPEDVVQEGKRFFDYLKASSDPAAIASQYKELYRQILAESA